MRISLDTNIDEETYLAHQRAASKIPAFPESCEARPEQWIARSMWQRSRILESRDTVVEWECRRMYGRVCSEITDGLELLDDWQDSMISSERWISLTEHGGRKLDDSIRTPLSMAPSSCWGDPTDPTSDISNETGGDCNDESADAHRDNAEGPGDLIGLFLDGKFASCETCLDGIDNNCDGSIDCADPAMCAMLCRTGHWMRWWSWNLLALRADAQPPASTGGERLYRSGLVVLLALFGLIRRKKQNRACFMTK